MQLRSKLKGFANPFENRGWFKQRVYNYPLFTLCKVKTGEGPRFSVKTSNGFLNKNTLLLLLLLLLFRHSAKSLNAQDERLATSH